MAPNTSRNNRVPGTVAIIINPISGRGPSLPRIDAITDHLEAAGYPVRRLTTEHPGHATQLATSLDDATAAALVCGGDGTVREVAAGLAGRPVPLYHVPAGNENLFANVFHMRPDPHLILSTLQQGTSTPIDLVTINGHLLCVACFGVGFDADVVRRVAAARTGPISNLDYLRPIWRTFCSHTFPVLHLEADGQTVFTGRGLILAGNLPRYATGLPVFPHAQPDDGLLDLSIWPCSGRLGLLKHALALGCRLAKLTGGIRLRAREVRISCDQPASSQIDGDVGPDLPLHALVRPAALRVLDPRSLR